MKSGGREMSRWLLYLSVMAGLVGIHHALLAHDEVLERPVTDGRASFRALLAQRL